MMTTVPVRLLEPRALVPAALTIAILLLAVVACGRKADPLPPQLVRPKPITSLRGEIVEKAVQLRWTRPTEYAGGKRMDDLGGFLVFRGQPGKRAERVAEIPVGDRDRFRREKDFQYVDEDVATGSYYYRVISYTTDLYYSDPSNQVDVEIEP